MRFLPLLLLASLAGSGEPAAPERPNVVLVVVDALRVDHMSLHGYERPTTPKIDALAERAVVFDRALSGSSWTLPSMGMLWTGVYHSQSNRRIEGAAHTFPEAFARAGYRTGGIVSNPLFGKVSGKKPGSDKKVHFDSGFERGFDLFDVHKEGSAKGKPAYSQTNGWLAEEVLARGTAWVESTDASEAPYLLYLHMFDPHFPRMPKDPERFATAPTKLRYGELVGRIPKSKRDPRMADAYPWVEDQLALYDCEVTHFDDTIGALFVWLEARGELENTVVVLTSDHGVQLFDEQVHVPLLIWAPGRGEPRRVAETVSLLDVTPTLHDLADIAPAAEARPFSVLSLFEDLDTRSDVFAFCTRGSSLTTDGRWRLHVPAGYRVERDGVGPELYDLAADPHERQPLDDATRTAAMSERVEAAISLFSGVQELNEEEAELRQSLLDHLGYTDQ
jgi:arylsulfatase A-like enzyme